jgi:ArsR family transcriptional regulator
LLQLARAFPRVIALDNSEEMLNQARRTIEAQEVHHVEFLLGDITHAPRRGLHCDLIVLNMVLHHIAAPVDVFREVHRLLNPGGVLLLVELISHDQDWVRESCGDVWLGFDSEDLVSWATEAGLVEGQSLYLGLRNGFQIQVRLFVKGNPPQEK